jgi:hypothetical protein
MAHDLSYMGLDKDYKSRNLCQVPNIEMGADKKRWFFRILYGIVSSLPTGGHYA